VFENVRIKMSLEHPLRIYMDDNELGQTGANCKVSNLNICRNKYKRTRRVVIFAKFMRNSALFKIVIVEVSF
jgi:hypothetical protein